MNTNLMDTGADPVACSAGKICGVAVVIPADQPADALITLTQALAGCGYKVIVVDDGSDESCAEIFQRTACTCLLRHGQNRGKGAALKTAFRHIRDQLPEIRRIVTMDADGQHSLRDMERAVSATEKNPQSLILGSRSFDPDVPWRSRLGNKITRTVFTAVSGTRLQDTQTGLRAFSRPLLDYMLSIEGERYEYEMNVLLHCRKNGVSILEIPIETIYHDEKNSCSHFDSVRDSLQIYRQILKFASASFLSFLTDYFLFLLLTAVFPSTGAFLMLGNIVARFGSAALNYTLNTKAVFHDTRSVSRTLPRYALLASGILLSNNLLLTLFVSALGIPDYIAKILTEAVLFAASFLLQSCVIFGRKKPAYRGGDRAPMRMQRNLHILP